MAKNSCFVTWWAAVLAMGVLGYWAWEHNLIFVIWQEDRTLLCTSIALLFGLNTLNLGRVARMVDLFNRLGTDYRSMEASELLAERIKRRFDVSWGFMDVCFTMALIGTVIGATMLFRTDLANVKDVASIQAAVGHLGSALGVAFITTAVGASAAVLLRIQCMVIDFYRGDE